MNQAAKTRWGTIVLIVTFSICISLPISAQIVHGMTEAHNLNWGGTNYIAGTVFGPSGTPIDSRMRLVLRSSTRGDFVSSTDANGQFIFGGLPEGLYAVIIDREADFEAVNYSLEILRSNELPKPTYNIMIRLRERAKSDARPSIIKVDNVGVPKLALEFYSKAIELAAKKDYVGAVAQLKAAISTYPNFFNAYNELGVQYQKLNDLVSADEAFVAALRIKPGAVEPMLNHGIVLFRLNRFADAELMLRDVLKVKDQSAIGHFYLGRTLAKLNSYDDAETELNLAITIGGTEMNEAHRMLAMVYIDKDDRVKAISSLETYLKLVPTAPDAEKLRDAIRQLKGQ